MSLEEKFKRLKEQRTIDANNKKLIGRKGKIRAILNTIGEKIYNQGEIDSSFFDDSDAYDNRELMEQMPTFNLEEGGVSDNPTQRPEGEIWHQYDPNFIGGNAFMMGLHFDGLSRGMHLEIQWIELEEKLEVRWRGDKVLEEIEGELVCYVPSSEWENMIEKLYSQSQSKQRKINKENKKTNAAIQDRRKRSLIDHMKKFWGV